jgi:hypothetical protein
MVDLDALRALCARVEAMAPGAVAGLTLVDDAQTHIGEALFPSLPTNFSQALTDVPLQPSEFGSCVKAIATGETITCPDVECDQLFDERWRKVCLEYGLKAVQSRPVYVGGKARGTFVLAYRSAKPEDEWNAALMTFAADAASKSLSK